MEIASLIHGKVSVKKKKLSPLPPAFGPPNPLKIHSLPHLPMHLGAGNVSDKKCTVKLDKSEPKRAEIFPIHQTNWVVHGEKLSVHKKQNAFSYSSLFHLNT